MIVTAHWTYSVTLSTCARIGCESTSPETHDLATVLSPGGSCASERREDTWTLGEMTEDS